MVKSTSILTKDIQRRFILTLRNILSNQDIGYVILAVDENSYIRRVYKTQIGKTIMQQLEEIRIDKAKQLLLEKQYKLSKIAEIVGFSDQFYSRKPSPNFIGIHREFNEDAFSNHIKKTVDLTRSCKTEFIFRDIYTLNGNREKIKRAVQIVRELMI